MCNKPKVVMKKFFRTVTALTLVCGAFAFTGCTDYEEDINSINNRLDELTTGQIASIEEQVGSLSDAIDEADGLISALQGDVDALETAKTTIEGQIKTLNDNIGTINGNISDINGKISGLETDLEKQIADAKAELEKADQANADRIDKLVSDLDQAKKDLQSEIEKGERYIRDLANITGIKFTDSKADVPEEVMSAVIEGIEIYIPLDELVDFEAEYERLQKEKTRLEGEVKRVRGKLSNEGFVSKAPEKVVNEEREKQAKYEDMLEKVKERLATVAEKIGK